MKGGPCGTATVWDDALHRDEGMSGSDERAPHLPGDDRLANANRTIVSGAVGEFLCFARRAQRRSRSEIPMISTYAASSLFIISMMVLTVAAAGWLIGWLINRLRGGSDR